MAYKPGYLTQALMDTNKDWQAPIGGDRLSSWGRRGGLIGQIDRWTSSDDGSQAPQIEGEREIANMPVAEVAEAPQPIAQPMVQQPAQQPVQQPMAQPQVDTTGMTPLGAYLAQKQQSKGMQMPLNQGAMSQSPQTQGGIQGNQSSISGGLGGLFGGM